VIAHDELNEADIVIASMHDFTSALLAQLNNEEDLGLTGRTRRS
jgi:hypothetical protein